MKKVIVCSLLFSLFGCSAHTGYQTITADETLARLEKGAVLIDVREVAEYQDGHISGSVNIPLGTLLNQIAEAVNDKEQTIIVYCRSGNRSKKAADELLQQGYLNVYDLGGINTWPYDIVK